VSDLDFDQLIHTAEGRLVIEVMQARRLPILIAATAGSELVFWYPPSVLDNLLADPERMLEWVRLLENHVEQLQALVPRQ
jgi:hypothetical protein